MYYRNRAGEMAQQISGLLHKHKALHSDPWYHHVSVHACDPSPGVMETEGSWEHAASQFANQ